MSGSCWWSNVYCSGVILPDLSWILPGDATVKIPWFCRKLSRFYIMTLGMVTRYWMLYSISRFWRPRKAMSHPFWLISFLLGAVSSFSSRGLQVKLDWASFLFSPAKLVLQLLERRRSVVHNAPRHCIFTRIHFSQYHLPCNHILNAEACILNVWTGWLPYTDWV